MKIACLSGKGGAGKTFAAVNLAAVAGECCYVDCDVEEPNGRLFFQPQGVRETAVTTALPGIVIQLTLIPVLLGALRKAGFLRREAAAVS